MGGVTWRESLESGRRSRAARAARGRGERAHPGPGGHGAGAQGCEPDLRVCGAFDTCRALMQALLRDPPDAVVMELSAGGGDVLDALGALPGGGAAGGAWWWSRTARTPSWPSARSRPGRGATSIAARGPKSLIGGCSRTPWLGEVACLPLHRLAAAAGCHLRQARPQDQAPRPGLPERARVPDVPVARAADAGQSRRSPRRSGISVKTLNAHKEHSEAEAQSTHLRIAPLNGLAVERGRRCVTASESS
jgi:hypothetical protein